MRPALRAHLHAAVAAPPVTATRPPPPRPPAPLGRPVDALHPVVRPDGFRCRVALHLRRHRPRRPSHPWQLHLHQRCHRHDPGGHHRFRPRTLRHVDSHDDRRSQPVLPHGRPGQRHRSRRRRRQAHRHLQLRPCDEAHTTTGTDQPYRYTGTYLDPSGLYKMGARYYDPLPGHFTQPDPSGRESNLYAYAAGDPVNRIDPSGLDFLGLDKKGWGNALDVAGTVVGAAALLPVGRVRR
nr:RHS repeat-associated core domain-containing protein [Streptomyces harenosi]